MTVRLSLKCPQGLLGPPYSSGTGIPSPGLIMEETEWTRQVS